MGQRGLYVFLFLLVLGLGVYGSMRVKFWRGYLWVTCPSDMVWRFDKKGATDYVPENKGGMRVMYLACGYKKTTNGVGVEDLPISIYAEDVTWEKIPVTIYYVNREGGRENSELQKARATSMLVAKMLGINVNDWGRLQREDRPPVVIRYLGRGK